jgi:PAS domain S-box-containing protein
MPNSVRSIQSRTILRVNACASLSDTLATGRRQRASHVAVFEKDRCLGVSSLHNSSLLTRSSTFGDLVEEQRCINISDSATIEEIGRGFADPDVEAQVVHTDEGDFVGVVTRQSLLESLLDERNLARQPPTRDETSAVRQSESLLAGEKRVLEAIATSRSQDGGLTELVEFVESQSDGALCSILLIDDSGECLWKGASPSLPEEFAKAIDGLAIGPNAGACGTAAFLDQVVIVPEVATAPICVNVRDLALKHEIRACWSCPIHSSSGDILGTIAMYYQQPGSPDEFHRILIERSVDLATIVIERRNAVSDLARSEKRLSRAQQIAHVGSFELDADGSATYWSDECFRIIGLEPDGEVPTHEYFLENVIHPDDRAMSQQIVQKALQECSDFDYEYRIRRQDGSVRWVNARGKSVCNSSNRTIFVEGTFLDITESKLASEQLVEQRFAISMAMPGISRSDMAGRYVEINDHYASALGYGPGELIGSEWGPTVHPEDLPRAMSAYETMRRDGKGEFEARAVRQDGSLFQKRVLMVRIEDADGEMTGHHCFMRDITEQKQAEDALRASETRSRTLLEGSPVCTKIIDLDSKLQYMSAAGQNQLKIDDIEPFYGTAFPPELYPEAWRAPVTERLERAKAGEICSLECPVRDTDGIEVWYETTFVPACDEDGSIQYVIVTSVNTTQRRQAEQEARTHRDELAHVSRVSTMGELATGIAHELNQPLTAIASYSYVAGMIVEQSTPDLAKLNEILGNLEDQAFRAGEIVRRLREFVTKADSARTRVDLNQLVRDVARFVEPDIRQTGVTLKVNLEQSPPLVLADTIQIQQVLVNLIRNAIDAMKETPVNEREVAVATRILQDGQAEVIVSDRGKGLDKNELEQVFNAFFSTKQEGMGMGLPISRSIVEAHGGKLWSKSNTGPGATFRFTIPQENGCSSDRTPTVFIVDDEVAVRDSLSMVVQTLGVTAKCYSSPVEFLDVIESFDTSCAVCLIVDVQMPDITGLELLDELAILNKAIPAIMITGHGNATLRHQAKELGAVAFLEKPFRPAEVRELIGTHLQQLRDIETTP